MTNNVKLFGAAALAAGLAVSGAALAQGTPQRGGTAVFSISQDPTTVNPDVSTNVPDRYIGCIAYQGLVQLTPDYKVLPLLAKSWSVSPDGLTYSFDLVDTEWHDGKPLVAEDVKYTLTEVSVKYSSIFKPAGDVIASIETPAKNKVVIKLKESFGPFMISLGCIQGAAIMPSHLFQGTNPLQNPATTTAPVGTGAFKMTEWKRGDYVKMGRNAKYYESGKPYLDEVIAKIVPQQASKMQALAAGELDVVQQIAPNDQAAVRANPKLKVVEDDIAPAMSLLFFNTKKKPFDDKKVRHALMMATDRDYLMKNAFFDLGGVGVAPFTTQIPWVANPSIDYRKMYPFDVAKANALLDEAGLKRGADGKRLSAKITTFATQYPELQQSAIAIKSMWQQVGIDLTIEALEDATIMKQVYQDMNYDVTLTSYTSYSDPALGVVRIYNQAMVGKSFGNPSGYTNAKVEELFDLGKKAINNDDRGKHYKEAQVILAEDLPAVVLRQYRPVDAASVRLNDLWGKVQGTGLWTDAWLSK